MQTPPFSFVERVVMYNFVVVVFIYLFGFVEQVVRYNAGFFLGGDCHILRIKKKPP